MNSTELTTTNVGSDTTAQVVKSPPALHWFADPDRVHRLRLHKNNSLYSSVACVSKTGALWAWVSFTPRTNADDPAILAQLPPLSHHEQIEAILSLPREFWPEKWLHERNDFDLIGNGEIK